MKVTIERFAGRDRFTIAFTSEVQARHEKTVSIRDQHGVLRHFRLRDGYEMFGHNMRRIHRDDLEAVRAMRLLGPSELP